MVEQARPKYITESEWIEELERVQPDISIPGYWDILATNCNQWAQEISVGPYWNHALEQVIIWSNEYRSKTGGALLARLGLPNFEGKSAKRIRSKLYQKRLEKDDYKFEVFMKDEPPIPKLNDLVRTRISCQYVDGVEFLANKLV